MVETTRADSTAAGSCSTCSDSTAFEFPRQVTDLYDSRLLTDVRQARAGDLLFFATTPHEASHVGISLGGGRFVHGAEYGWRRAVEELDVSYWTRRFLGVRRVSPN